MDAPLQPAQLAQQPFVVGNSNSTAIEARQRLYVQRDLVSGLTS